MKKQFYEKSTMFKNFIKLFAVLLLANGCCNISYSSSEMLQVNLNKQQTTMLKQIFSKMNTITPMIESQIKETFHLKASDKFNNINNNFIQQLKKFNHYYQLCLDTNEQNKIDINDCQYIVQRITQICQTYIKQCNYFYLNNKNTTENIKHYFTYNKKKLKNLIKTISNYIQSIEENFNAVINNITWDNKDNEEEDNDQYY